MPDNPSNEQITPLSGPPSKESWRDIAVVAISKLETAFNALSGLASVSKTIPALNMFAPAIQGGADVLANICVKVKARLLNVEATDVAMQAHKTNLSSGAGFGIAAGVAMAATVAVVSSPLLAYVAVVSTFALSTLSNVQYLKAQMDQLTSLQQTIPDTELNKREQIKSQEWRAVAAGMNVGATAMMTAASTLGIVVPPLGVSLVVCSAVASVAGVGAQIVSNYHENKAKKIYEEQHVPSLLTDIPEVSNLLDFSQQVSPTKQHELSSKNSETPAGSATVLEVPVVAVTNPLNEFGQEMPTAEREALLSLNSQESLLLKEDDFLKDIERRMAQQQLQASSTAVTSFPPQQVFGFSSHRAQLASLQENTVELPKPGLEAEELSKPKRTVDPNDI